jgi:hypothetical protein
VQTVTPHDDFFDACATTFHCDTQTWQRQIGMAMFDAMQSNAGKRTNALAD